MVSPACLGGFHVDPRPPSFLCRCACGHTCLHVSCAGVSSRSVPRRVLAHQKMPVRPCWYFLAFCLVLQDVRGYGFFHGLWLVPGQDLRPRGSGCDLACGSTKTGRISLSRLGGLGHHAGTEQDGVETGCGAARHLAVGSSVGHHCGVSFLSLGLGGTCLTLYAPYRDRGIIIPMLDGWSRQSMEVPGRERQPGYLVACPMPSRRGPRAREREGAFHRTSSQRRAGSCLAVPSPGWLSSCPSIPPCLWDLS